MLDHEKASMLVILEINSRQAQLVGHRQKLCTTAAVSADTKTGSRPVTKMKRENKRPEDMSDDMTSGRASEVFNKLARYPASSGRGPGSTRSIGIRGKDFATVQGDQSPQGNGANGGFDETNAAVTEEAVDTAGVKREQFIVGAGVVAACAKQPGVGFIRCLFMGRYIFVVGHTRYAIARIGLGPTPVAPWGRG